MKISVAFSGGGARCLAQLGYMEVLLDLGIKPSALSGSSGGSIAAAFLALGYSPKEALSIIKSFPFRKIKLNLFKGSIFTLEGLVEELKNLGLTSFEACQLPLFICLTGYDDGKSYYVHEGDLSRAVLASSALLPIFAPVEFEGTFYIDGGFSDNLPVTPLPREHFRLGLNVNPLHFDFKRTLWGNFKRAGYIMLNTNIKHSIQRCDKYVEFEECGKFDILDRKHFDEIYAIGKRVAEAHKEEWERKCQKN